MSNGMGCNGMGCIVQCHGADPGFFQTKHSHAGGKRILYPSLAGPTPDSLGQADLGKTALLYRMLEPWPMLVGKYAYAQKVGSPDIDAKWFQSDRYLALLLAGLSDNSSFSLSYKLCLGLPIDHMSLRDELQARISGTHTVLWDHIGSVQTIHIDAVVVAQGIGALATFVVDEDGNPTVPVDQLRNDENAIRMACLDLGAGTSCAVSVRGLHVVTKETRSFALGAWNVERQCREALIATYGEGLVRGLGKHELLHVLRTNTLFDRGQHIDARAMFDAACASVARDIVAECHALWGEARTFQKFVMVGGGSILLGRHIRQAWPHIETLPRPVFSNSEGYRRIAALALQ